ncbi:C-type lectin domain family 12 member B-like [Hemibagrus wyckioides]|uniref:C-type lectin domain family 12 member B-like n=1 Tax=Hemibagrus wyckioides TaxID=337641 RepID=UPI00266D63C8|nr:C-type lectin domain family 12 member B-like [Hemibagrus wyckioides]
MASSCGINRPNRQLFHKIQKEDMTAAQYRVFWLTGLCLGLLCILQATLNIVLRLHSDPRAKSDEQGGCYNQTIEIDELLTSYNNLTSERDKLLAKYNSLNIEKDDILDKLTGEKNELQAENIKLNNALDKLRTRYNTIEQDNVFLQKKLDALDTQEKHRWQMFGSSIYYFSMRKSWTESRQDCREKDADLVIIDSEEEQEFINEKLGSSLAWIGLSHSYSWNWVDSTPLHSRYRANELNSYVNTMRCAVTAYQQNRMEHWFDENCNKRFVWVCEKKRMKK